MQINVEKILRKINTEDKIFKGAKRVKVIKAVDCVMALSKKGLSVSDIKKEINILLEDYKIVRVKINEKNLDFVDLSITKNVNATDIYMWTEEKYDFLSLFIGISVIALIFSFAMFRAWPIWLQQYAYYIRYPIYGILGLFIVIIILRLIVYGITYFTHSKGLWLFPNFLAECGILESFVPTYAWEGAEEESEKKD